MSSLPNTVPSLIKAQKALINQMNNFITNTNQTPAIKKTHGFYVARINGWHDLWQKFLLNEEQINQLVTSEDLSNSYFTEQLFAKTEATFYETKGDLVDKLDKIDKERNEESVVHIHDSTVESRPTVQAKLPRISLPKFSGNYHEWVSFKDLYLSVIHNNSSLDDVQKFHYLKTILIGDAASIIKQFSITAANYSSAWSALTARYENKRAIVTSLLKTFTSQQKIMSESANAIKGLLDTTSECLASLKNLKINTVHWDPLIVHILTQKLPAETLKSWEEALGDSSDVPTWEELKKFLELKFRTLEAIKRQVNIAVEKKSDNNKPKSRIQSFVTTHSLCVLCHNDHSLRSCQKFLALTHQERLRIAKSNRCCLNCLGRYHSINKCLSKARCSECNEKHHTLLHGAIQKSLIHSSSNGNKNSTSAVLTLRNNQPEQEAHKKQEASTSKTFSYFITENKQVLLATAIIYIQTPAGMQANRALIDPGSQATFITNSALRRMNLTTTSTLVKISGLGNTETASSRKVTQLIIHSTDTGKNLKANAIVLDQLTDLLPPKTVFPNEWAHLNGLKLADPNFYIPNRIDILIGADIYPFILLDGVKSGAPGAPLAQNTIFGWILTGEVYQRANTGKLQIQSFVNTINLCNELKQFWEIEEVDSPKVKTSEDVRCEEWYQNTHYRKEDGTYVVRLPFKKDVENLGASRHIALKRFLSIEKSNNAKGIITQYNDVLAEYLTSNHMEEVSMSDTKPTVNYFPHHAVIKDTSTTTKLRVVFDASCKTTNGNSLNDILLTGPALQQDITTIIMRWRFHKYVFTADIEKMYRQVWIHPDDADYQRIIWRPTPNQSIKDYRLLTVTFGVSCAPYLAIRTLHQLAYDEKQNFPDATECLLNDFYVDDVLTGSENLAQTRNLKNELIQLLKGGGFHLRKFSANHPDILKDLPQEDVSPESVLQFHCEPITKTLGITWNAKHDTFQYKLNLDMSKTITKRTILSNIAKLFDPLGWISPVLICGKILMQKLWLAGLDWDTFLSEPLLQEWLNFANELKHIEQIKLPRWINYTSSKVMEFHGFCDSSERAYAAVIYVRIIDDNKTISTSLFISKTKVAPVKTISIPRLELCAAHLLSKLVKNLKDNLGKAISCYLWTDSTIVLAWLNAHPNRWKSFVANRVTEIHNNTGEFTWRHVPSEQNPADLASRGCLPTILIKQSLWWDGPAWLKKSHTSWPEPKTSYNSIEVDHELKKVRTYQCSTSREELIERFSNVTRAYRVIAYCKRFMARCKSRNVSFAPYLTAEELQQAKFDLIKESQRLAYKDEIISLENKTPISKKSCLLSLNPFLDENGILRVGGRLEHSSLTFDEKHPIILSRHSKLTSLLINHAHQVTLHGGINLVTAKLRRQYWISSLKVTLKKLLHQCVVCSRWRMKNATQIMGDLPSKRVRPERPFSATGIDFAGPITIKLSKTRNAKTTKAYIAIFICFATKAIHIEAVGDLSAEAFMAALRRFFSRRGVCKDIFSDNGTNFVGASNILQKEVSRAIKENTKVAAEKCATQFINWHFIPPGAPHFGGLWEAGVKSIKHHLRRIIGQTLLTFEELTTVLAQIEAVLNSRPLTALSTNPEEFTPLTPGHFLIGSDPTSLPEEDYTKSNISCLSRWQHLQKLKGDFWKRWSSEYLNRLQQRPKWKIVQPPIKVGDLVLLKDDNLLPCAWKLARIIEIHPGRDNRIRVVTVKTPQTVLKRPITRICPLPFETTHTNDEQAKQF